MARIVKNSDASIISCLIITKFKDGTESTRELKVDDVVENLRYIKNEEIVTISGRISAINTSITKVTSVDINDPKDYFDTDVTVKSIAIDSSEHYQSKITIVPAMEIIEDEGVVDVERMFVKAYAYETMQMTYSDETVVDQELEVGDVLVDTVIMTDPGKPDITGTFKILAWDYKSNNTIPEITGVYLRPITGGKCVKAQFANFISFNEYNHADVTDTNSLSQITEQLNLADTVFAQLDVDVTIPKRDDGRITTTMIGEGKTLNLDLNGHEISCQAYAFYVNGGTLNISDSTNSGKIECTYAGAAYPAVYVASGGTCNMDGGLIDTTNVDTSETYNWLYGVVCSGDGVFNMTGGKMKIGGAAGVSITNGTASGEGSRFIIGGDSEITSIGCAAVYLADNKSVTIKDNAVINGGIVVRMGDINIEDNAVINGHKPGEDEPLGEQVTFSGVMTHKAAILALTGVYGSELGNDLSINIADTAKINAYIDNGIDVAFVNTRYDQVAVVDIANESAINAVANPWNVYTHDELAEMATAAGKTLGPETNTTNLTVLVSGEVVYPVVDEEG